MSEHFSYDILQGVSRSFYLSLRLLPRPMREAASLGYLLARTSDTIADSGIFGHSQRLECLEAYAVSIAEGGALPRWPVALIDGVSDLRERHLLMSGQLMLDGLRRLSDGQAELVREVLEVIISGQRMDLVRFENASPERPVALRDEHELDDYTWRVAGCVGAFWTKLGYQAMEDSFSKAPVDLLLEQGISYGKGLQMVNILRDLPQDLWLGRCYLPVDDCCDKVRILGKHQEFVERALTMVGQGRLYARSLGMRRLQVASVLPAQIAEETLVRMRGVTWGQLEARIKVPRSRVYLSLMRATLGVF